MLLLYGLLAAWLAASMGALAFAFDFYRSLGSPGTAETKPPACVIAPVKGAGRHLDAFMGRLRGLDYGSYRVAAVVESEADPAWAALTRLAARPGAPLSVLVAGLAVDEGQKVHNIRHALAELRPEDSIVAFIDADTLPEPDWLDRLVRPLGPGSGIDAVTGHRWIYPDDDGVWSALVASANMSVLAAPRLWSVCWGGTLALRRETLDALDLRDRIAGAVVDDVQITRVLWDAGLRILTPRSLVVPSPARHDARSAFAFGRRQYQFVRRYLPGTWGLAALILTVPSLGVAAALVLAFAGNLVGLAALTLAAALSAVRSVLRSRIARRLWGEDVDRIYGRQRVSDLLLPPLWTALHVVCLWASLVGRTIVWAGVTYEVLGRTRTRVVRRRAELAS